MSGLSDASMHAADARWYSRTTGLSWCERERDPRRPAAQRLADRELVCGVGDGPEQAHANRLDAPLDELGHDVLERRRVQRAHDLPAVVHALVDLERERTRDIRIGVFAGVLERELAPAHAEDEHVRVARRREERRPGRGVRQDRVGRTRSPVDDRIATAQQVTGRDALGRGRAADRLEDALDRVVGGGRRLVQREQAVRVPDDDVGERATRVDREPHVRSRRRSRVI
jgi:hypothetical protein